jgi:hypothetical protein
MSLVLAVQTDRTIAGIDEIRARLGDSSNVRGSVTPILREGARVGTEFARLHAPRGSTGKLAGAIEDDAIVFRIRGDVVAARFGVQPVRDPGRGSRLYPIYVHEGTGLYGRLHRVITPKRSPVMVFPGGGKPWPTVIGRTGRVVKRSVRGQRAQPYMHSAYEEAKVYVEAHLDEIFRRLVE